MCIRDSFYSAEDADSEGHEGKFYCWTHDALSQLLTWARLGWGFNTPPLAGPILYDFDDDGTMRSSEDDDDWKAADGGDDPWGPRY